PRFSGVPAKEYPEKERSGLNIRQSLPPKRVHRKRGSPPRWLVAPATATGPIGNPIQPERSARAFRRLNANLLEQIACIDPLLIGEQLLPRFLQHQVLDAELEVFRPTQE